MKTTMTHKILFLAAAVVSVSALAQMPVPLLDGEAAISTTKENKNLSIQEIPINLSLTETEILIRKIYPDFKPLQIRDYRNRPYGFRYSENPEKTGSSEIIVSVDSKNNVWFIGQARNFSPDNLLDYKALRQSLIEKYGTPTMPAPEDVPVNSGNYSIPEYIMGWSFVKNRQLVKLTGNSYKAKEDPCDPQEMAGDDYSKTNGARLTIPRATKPTCSLRIIARIRFDYYTKRVVALSVGISDATILYADPILGQASRDAEEKRLKLESNVKSKQKAVL
jgi:hypothetical protein